MNWFWTLILLAYCLVVHFGVLFRFGTGEAALGVSTVLAFGILFSALFKIPGQVRKTPIFWLFFLLFGWIALSSILSPTGILAAYMRLGQVVLYLGIAAALSTWEFPEKRLRLVAYILGIAVITSCGLTIVDHLGWVNVPYCNSVGIHAGHSSRIETLGTTTYVERAGGFFARRTAMAAVLSISITALTILALSKTTLLRRLFYAAAAGAGAIAVLLTHNRSCVAGIGITLALYFVLNTRLTMQQRAKAVILGSLLLVGVFFVAKSYFPTHLEIYQNKLSFQFSQEDERSKNQVSADSLRSETFLAALDGITDNPFGNGIGYIPTETYGVVSTHNVITSWIWAAGVFAIVWLIPFTVVAYRTLLSNAHSNFNEQMAPYFDAIRFAWIAWFIHCMAHENFSTGLAWVFIGILASMQRKNAEETQYLMAQRSQQAFGYGMPRMTSG